MTDARLSLLDHVRLLPLMCRMTWDEIRLKRGADVRVHDGADPVAAPPRQSRAARLVRKARNLLAFLRRMANWNSQLLRHCCGQLRQARAAGSQEIVLYGEGQAAAVVLDCAALVGVKVRAACPFGLPVSRLPQSLPHWPESTLATWEGPIIVAALANSQRHVDRLTRLTIPRERLILLETS